MKIFTEHSFSGCSAARLARLNGVQEVPSSNLGTPTSFFVVDVVQWQSTGLWFRLLWVRVPSSTPFLFITSIYKARYIEVVAAE